MLLQLSSHSKADIKNYLKTEVIKFKGADDNHIKTVTVPRYVAQVYYLELKPPPIL